MYVLQNKSQATAYNGAGVDEVYSKACFLTTASILENHHGLFNIFQNINVMYNSLIYASIDLQRKIICFSFLNI